MAGSTSVCWREIPFWLLWKPSEIRTSFPNSQSWCHGVRSIGKYHWTYYPGTQFEKVGENCDRPTIWLYLYYPMGNDLQPLRTFQKVPIYIYEQRTKPITSAKGRGWNGHRFLCVPYRSWGFGVRGHEMTKWLKKIEAEAAEEKAAMKMNSFLLARKPFWRSLWGCVCKDSETKKMVIVRSSFWSSFWAAFHFRIFEVCSFCAWY